MEVESYLNTYLFQSITCYNILKLPIYKKNTQNNGSALPLIKTSVIFIDNNCFQLTVPWTLASTGNWCAVFSTFAVGYI